MKYHISIYKQLEDEYLGIPSSKLSNSIYR